MFHAAPSGGTIDIVVDEESGFLARFELVDALGRSVEVIEYADVLRDENGALPLHVDRTTHYPVGREAARSVERFRGRSLPAKAATRLALLIPPGARVTDFRVTPHVVYEQGPTPMSDERLMEISSRGTERAETAQQRTDPGEAEIASFAPQDATRSDQVADGKWAWAVAIGLAVLGSLALAIAVIRRRKYRAAES